MNFNQFKEGKKGYGGQNGDKYCIIIDNEYYMLKLPSKTKVRTKLSYRNSSITEHISCLIINSIGLEVQETILGTYTTLNSNGQMKEYIGVACKDFVPKDCDFIEFTKINNRVARPKSQNKSVSLEKILYTIENQKNYNISALTMKDFFWKQFVVDTLLANFDRNNSNWGIIYNESGSKDKMAPIYDCAGCLFPQADDKEMRRILNDKLALIQSTYEFPKSVLTINNNRIRPYDVFISTNNQIILEALKYVVDRVDMSKISNIINSTPYIDNLQKDFYTAIIENRLEQVLKYCLERNPNIDTSLDERKVDNVRAIFDEIEVKQKTIVDE